MGNSSSRGAPPQPPPPGRPPQQPAFRQAPPPPPPQQWPPGGVPGGAPQLFITPEQLQAMFLAGHFGAQPHVFGGPFGGAPPGFALPPVPPPRVEHATTIRNDINVKKGSLRVLEDAGDVAAGLPPHRRRLYVDFALDTAAPCAVTLLWCVEEAGPKPPGVPLSACFRPLAPAGGGAGERAPRPVRRVYPKGLGQLVSGAAAGLGHLETDRFSLADATAAGQARSAVRPGEPHPPPPLHAAAAAAAGGGAAAGSSGSSSSSSHVYGLVIVLEAAGEAEAVGDTRTLATDERGFLVFGGGGGGGGGSGVGGTPAAGAGGAAVPSSPPAAGAGRVQLQATYAALAFNGKLDHAAHRGGGGGGGDAAATGATPHQLAVPSKAWSVRPLKQKIAVDCDRIYELREIYGVDGASASSSTAAATSSAAAGGSAAATAATSDAKPEVHGGERDGHTESVLSSTSECVICLTEPRDTTVIPCRHMCLCHECALQLRLNTNRCPICRARE